MAIGAKRALEVVEVLREICAASPSFKAYMNGLCPPRAATSDVLEALCKRSRAFKAYVEQRRAASFDASLARAWPEAW